MKVKIQHRLFGEIVLDGITEIHYNYNRTLGLKDVRIAFESDIRRTGDTYDFDDILEFEAVMPEILIGLLREED